MKWEDKNQRFKKQMQLTYSGREQWNRIAIGKSDKRATEAIIMGHMVHWTMTHFNDKIDLSNKPALPTCFVKLKIEKQNSTNMGQRFLFCMLFILPNTTLNE